jgi:flagellin
MGANILGFATPAAGDSDSSTPTGDPIASISGDTLTVDGTAAADGNLVLSFDAGADITVAVTAGDSVDTIASTIAAASNVSAAPVASISGNTLTVDGTAATAGNLVLSLDSGPDITIPLDGNEADAAAIATKIETAVNDAFTEFPDHGNPATVGPSSGTIATANGDGTVTFDFTNPTAALVVSVSGGNYSGQYDGGTLMTIAPNAVGSSGLLELRFDQGSNIDVEFDGNEADLDAIAAKIVTAINDNIPTNSGGTIATANGNGTITFDFSDAGGSGSGFNGVSYVEVRESDPFNTARLEPATSVQINTTTTTVAGVPVATATGSDVVFDFSIASGDYTDTSSIALGAATDVAQAVAADDSGSDVPTAPVTSVGTADDARVTIKAIDKAIMTVNIQRSELGAVSNRLSHTVNNLTNISSNLSAAQGGIEDADFAHETTMLAKKSDLAASLDCNAGPGQRIEAECTEPTARLSVT